ncbi:conserved hypothetical protein [Theileria equi strain WA]|uniref:Uncharacterized protein n=1 Tax=Theileria equi strain WA TaxID=1537102 RepID=L1LEP9_THEEQ|nr:conserved hypothetical protein [Theileria equi strain WA]EKX73806.1 conserved hypothetical protein [Theileria equi strain WA]|eukprot:XP_004833258.1 conserved hypothetical protein [Theileria equi strain WA]
MFRKKVSQNNFFYRNNGNESSKSHSKTGHNPSNFDKHVKNDDNYKDQHREDGRAHSHTDPEKNDPKLREQTSSHGETVEDLTKSILKWHASRFKDIRKACLANETNHNDGFDTKPVQDVKHATQQESKQESSPENGHTKGYRSNSGFGNYGSNFRRDRSNHDKSKYNKDR